MSKTAYTLLEYKPSFTTEQWTKNSFMRQNIKFQLVHLKYYSVLEEN